MPSTINEVPHCAVREDDSYAKMVRGSHYKLDDSSYHSCPSKDSSTPYSGTGIKIRSREPRNRPASVNSTNQGTTSRRIRLSMENRPNSVTSINSDEANSTEQESQSLITEVSSIIYACVSIYL